MDNFFFFFFFFFFLESYKNTEEAKIDLLMQTF